MSPRNRSFFQEARPSNAAPNASKPNVDPPTVTDDPKEWLDAALRACPRTAADKWNLVYARRLKKYDRRLDNAALAKGSGARISSIVQDSTINPSEVTDEQEQWLNAAQKACERAEAEGDLTYARRLKAQDPRLGNAALANASGAKAGDLARDPRINPPKLTAEQEQWLGAAQQRCRRWINESDIAYARRLKRQDARLGDGALSKASDARVSDIAQDPTINPPQVTDEQEQWLNAAQQACPRTDAEKSDLAYARRLKGQDDRLVFAALSKASGARVGDLVKDPKINPPKLTEEQERQRNAAQLACPRTDFESDLAYARRLKQQDPDLDNATLATASGAKVSDLVKVPNINPPKVTDEQQQRLDAAQRACPRMETESDIGYARRLTQKDPGLVYAALSKACGATIANIRADPKVSPPKVTEEQQRRLDAAQQACERTNAESNVVYAQRLKEHDPRLDNAALSRGSGAKVAHIIAAAKKWGASYRNLGAG